VTEIRNKKKKVVHKKKLPGYILVEMEMDEDVKALIRDTVGVGDFLGANGEAEPMSTHDIDQLLERNKVREPGETGDEGTTSEQDLPKFEINFDVGDRVKIKEGTFENFDGVVEEIFPAKQMVKVVVTIFNQATPVEIECWKVEPI
jgi:transcriptional antiterminator NusG